MASCTTFLRVPDIPKTIQWYESIGFRCIATNLEIGCELDWALIDWDGARFMLYPEGRNEYGATKDAGLYFDVPSIDEIIPVIKMKAELIEINEETFYGKREVVFKDINGFQLTFGSLPTKE